VRHSPTNTVSPALFSPIALDVVSQFPQSSNPCGLITYGLPNKLNSKQIIGKTDWRVSDEHQIMGRDVHRRQATGAL
jgi:hypothetical protein